MFFSRRTSIAEIEKGLPIWRTFDDLLRESIDRDGWNSDVEVIDQEDREENPAVTISRRSRETGETIQYIYIKLAYNGKHFQDAWLAGLPYDLCIFCMVVHWYTGDKVIDIGRHRDNPEKMKLWWQELPEPNRCWIIARMYEFLPQLHPGDGAVVPRKDGWLVARSRVQSRLERRRRTLA